MKLQQLVGVALIACLMMVGCDAERGTKTASKSDSSGNTPKSASGSEDLSKYAGFEIKNPDAFDGEFNPNGLEVGPEVGKLAPEIDGVDLDGVPFKLSDYRGKVVMLDFYGDW